MVASNKELQYCFDNLLQHEDVLEGKSKFKKGGEIQFASDVEHFKDEFKMIMNDQTNFSEL